MNLSHQPKPRHRSGAAKLALAAGAVLLTSGRAMADIIWQGGNSTWFNAANWSSDSLPTSSSVVEINSGTANVPDNPTGAMASGIDVGFIPGTGTLDFSASMGTLGPTYENVGVTGTGVLIQSGGYNSTSNVILGEWAPGMGTYLLSAGTLQVYPGGGMRIGFEGTGSFIQTGGRIFDNQTLEMAQQPGSFGYYALTAGTLAQESTAEIIGDAATAIFNQSGGYNDLVGGGLTLGAAKGSSGSYVLSGGTIGVGTYGTEEIGQSGIGSFTQSGGLNSITTGIGRLGLLLAVNASSTATYTLSGGTLAVEATESIGYSGTATFTQTGGANQITFNSVQIAANPGSQGTYNLFGGIFNDNEVVDVGTSQSSGTLNVANANCVARSLSNSGLLTLYGASGANSAGIVTTTQSFIQSSTAQLAIGLGGESPGSQYGQITTLSTATLAGSLTIALSNGFLPQPYDQFEIISAGAISGTFANITLPTGNNLDLAIEYTPTSVLIVDLPEPTAISLLAIPALSLLKRRRKPPQLKHKPPPQRSG